MPAPKKTLEDLVRDGTFNSKRRAHREKLQNEPLRVRDDELQALQQAYVDAADERERQRIARRFRDRVRARGNGAGNGRARTLRERQAEWEKWHGLHWRLLRGESTDADVEDLKRHFGPKPFENDALDEYIEILREIPPLDPPRARPARRARQSS